MPKQPMSAQTSLRFSDDQWLRVTAAARAQHETISVYLRKAVMQRVEREAHDDGR